MVFLKEFFFSRENNRFIIATQIGTVDISSAVKPDGTNCSAHTTPPLPPRSKRSPIIAADL